MKITYVASGYWPLVGGVERHVAELARRMAADGHAVEVLAPDTEGTELRTDTVDGIAVRRVSARPGVGRLAGALEIAARVARSDRRVGLVHAHNYHALPALAAALGSVRPLVVTPHYLGTGEGARLRLLHAAYRPLGRTMLRRAVCIICVSRAEAQLLRRDLGRLPARVTVVPNGVDAEGIRRAEPCSVEGRVVLTAGRLERYKDMGSSIRALGHLDGDFRLVIAGDGPDRGRLERLSVELGVADRVALVGRLSPSELHRWYRTADVYITLSPRECFGITLLEALVAGAGVVASDIPAHREVLHDNPGGVVALVPPSSPSDEIARAIRQVAGRDHCSSVSASTWDDVAERHARIYHQVVRGA